jgi:phage tail protein X
MDNEIRIKMNASLGPILSERATMQRALITTKTRLATVENQLSNSLPGSKFQGDWLMVVDFFTRHTYPQSSTVGDKIETVLASNNGAAGGNQICSHGVEIGTL